MELLFPIEAKEPIDAHERREDNGLIFYQSGKQKSQEQEYLGPSISFEQHSFNGSEIREQSDEEERPQGDWGY